MIESLQEILEQNYSLEKKNVELETINSGWEEEQLQLRGRVGELEITFPGGVKKLVSDWIVHMYNEYRRKCISSPQNEGTGYFFPLSENASCRK